MQPLVFQTTLDLVASLAEKCKNIGQWKNPYASALLAVLMLVATVALYFIPLRFIILGKVTPPYWSQEPWSQEPWSLEPWSQEPAWSQEPWSQKPCGHKSLGHTRALVIR